LAERSILKAPVNDAEGKEILNARLKALMEQDKVMLFMKGTPDAPRCGFSRKIVGLLQDQKVKYGSFDILSDESVRSGTASPWSNRVPIPNSTQPGLKVYNDWPTFPQLIVNGEFVGGLDVVQDMVNNGEFKELIV
jgi:Grx4 family monothiol glutaredoxin